MFIIFLLWNGTGEIVLRWMHCHLSLNCLALIAIITSSFFFDKILIDRVLAEDTLMLDWRLSFLFATKPF